MSTPDEAPPALVLEPPPLSKRERDAAQLAAMTRDAMRAYNEALAKPHGLLAKATDVGFDRRCANVKRCLSVAADICRELYGSPLITLRFWEDYFAEVRNDDFLNGRGPYRGAHANWRPSFEFLTRPATMQKVFDAAMSANG